MEKVFLIYPHQLFEEIFKFPNKTQLLLVEDPLFVGDAKYPLKFHKQKLILHRASMRNFYDRLKKKGFSVTYIDYSKELFKFLKQQKIKEIHLFDPVDFILEKRLVTAAKKESWKLTMLETPNFLTAKEEIKTFFKGKKHYSMNTFYIAQRKRLGILLEKGKPKGGKWSFDVENRKKMPSSVKVPKLPGFTANTYVKEAQNYVKKHFPKNPGNAEDFAFPINHVQAKKMLKDFIAKRLKLFGPYEDAIVQKEHYLFHSVLSAPLNCGLLSPQDIVDEVLQAEAVPIASLEGFIRQVIGWREFMRATYILEGSRIRNSNRLKHTNKLTQSWYEGTIGVEPIDNTIQKVLKTAYCHHIERLMVLGNFMLLCQLDPNEVYKWFMELFIDAYDWVMVPNVYSMSQFADGGLITTKPYFSSSNYILKMSDYKRGEWADIWDALFYVFLEKHRNLIGKNPRLALLLKNLDKKSPAEKRAYKTLINRTLTSKLNLGEIKYKRN